MSFFSVLCNSNESGVKARCGLIKTSHSDIETPVFMPVGTAGSVKAIENRELYEFDSRVILANTYHLSLKPGMKVLSDVEGLHKFMNWKHSILTDSGGYQVFSLNKNTKISDEGVQFTSHLDGSLHFFSPERVIEIQRIIGSDIMMPLDECLPYPVDRTSVAKSISRTHEWEKKCLEAFNSRKESFENKQFLFSINQGSVYKDLRMESILRLNELDFDGNAIGGLAVGEKNSQMYDIIDHCTDYVAKDKPVYLMGVGTPVDIIESVERGVDMFDCVLPTRNARHGRIFTTFGELNINNARFFNDYETPDKECHTYTSDNFSMSYLRHLFNVKEIMAAQLVSIHNIGFYYHLMKQIRESIKKNKFLDFKKSFLNKYLSKNR